MKLLTITEAAAVKGVTKQAIAAAIESGRLPTVTIELPVKRIDAQVLATVEFNPNMQKTGRPRNGSKRKDEK